MKKLSLLFLSLLSFMVSDSMASGMGSIGVSNPHPKTLLKSTNSWSAAQNFSSITVNGVSVTPNAGVQLNSTNTWTAAQNFSSVTAIGSVSIKTSAGVTNVKLDTGGDSYLLGGNFGLGTASLVNTAGWGRLMQVTTTDYPAISLRKTAGAAQQYDIANDGGTFSIFDQTQAAYRLRMNTSGALALGPSIVASRELTITAGDNTPARIAMATREQNPDTDDVLGRMDFGGSNVDGFIQFPARILATSETNWTTSGGLNDDVSAKLEFQTLASADALGNDGAAPTTKMVIAGNGNIGIGDASPVYPLEVDKTNSAAITFPLAISNKDSAANTGVGIYFNPTALTAYDQGIGQLVVKKINASNDFQARMDFNVTNVAGNIQTPLVVLASPDSGSVGTGGNVGIGTVNPSSKLDISGGSITVRGGGGISASSYTVNGRSLFVSSFTPAAPTFADGAILMYTTGTINANTTKTFNASDYGAASIHAPKCGVVEQVNTSGNTVRVKSLSDIPNSFTCYNADLTQNQGYWAEFWLKY